jgi:hypothetical protein
MIQDEGQATITFSHMNSFGDYTNFECSLRDETADALVDAFRRFLLSVGYMPGTVNDVLGEEL